MAEVRPNQILCDDVTMRLGNREHLKYLRNTIVLQGKSQSGMRKLDRKQEC